MGDTCPRLLFDAVENQVLRRWTHGPPSPGVIRTTAKNRFDSQPQRMAITIDAAPALAAASGTDLPAIDDHGAHKSLAAKVAHRADATPSKAMQSRDGGVAAATRLVSAATRDRK